MAYTTDPSLRNITIYSVYVRNHTPEGTFRALESDLDRICNLGVSVLWLMPIYPIGKAKRKGTLGSPYAIQDYREINPEYGGWEDFKSLLASAHERGIRVIIDIVFNHTSPDSILRKEHSEWFWRTLDNRIGRKVSEWTDVIDLDYGNPNLWNYQKNVLIHWLRMGVDGFRCDVAALLPLPFWLEAREACTALNPNVLWLAETMEPHFVTHLRRFGHSCLSDTEILRIFDIGYEYDTYPLWRRYLSDEVSLETLLDGFRDQEAMLYENALKLRFLENHDQRRSADLLKNETVWRQWTAFSFFIKGTALLYAGQENRAKHTPSLFEKDSIVWCSNPQSENFLKTLISLKKDAIVRDGFFWLPQGPKGMILAAYERRNPEGRLIALRAGIFNVEESRSTVNVGKIWPELLDATFLTERLNGSRIPLDKGRIRSGNEPFILDWGLTG